ncbi:hypothetical protein C8F04DRAFT_1189601 [Mycena alexandri]|uniref:Uncharacterized protein n=1 Tax=Mycena alexandri TaxID=1745969 RepID=A0AAD6WVZ8_9AGAR|nr:hypothetical protein C8F04DRAFT_1189601 [Mycena alexandri]
MEIAEVAARARKELEHEHERESHAASAVTEWIPDSIAPSVIAGTLSASLARSEQEADMWNKYALNGADFTAGDDVEDPRIRYELLSKEADSLGVWNPEAVARGLGLGNVDVAQDMLVEDEEEDFLSEIMRNAGEWAVESWLGFGPIGRSHDALIPALKPNVSQEIWVYRVQTLCLYCLLFNTIP